jgi:hypothetical protein
VSERTLKQLVGALVLVTVVWLVASLFSGSSGSIAASGEAARFFDALGAESVEAVTIARRGGTLSLERADRGWTVNGFPADSGSVGRLLEALGDAEIGDLVATNPQNHARMGVSSDSAATLTLRVGDSTRAILVGGSGPRYGTAYARFPDRDPVYLIDGDLRTHVVRSLDEWRNRTMVAIDTALVARVEIEMDGDSYVLARADSAWVHPDGSAVPRTVIDGVLSELARLVASGFVAEGDSIAGLEPASTTRAHTEAGELLAEVTIGSGSGDRWARTSTDDYLYRVSSFRAGRIAPAQDGPGGGA